MFNRCIALTIGTAALLAATGWLAAAQTTAQATPRHAPGVSEVAYRVSDSRAVMMNLAGSTPISTWSMKAHGIHGTAEMTTSPLGELLGIHTLTFALPVHNLKGEHKAMDEHAYAALKAGQYKEITFELTHASIQAQGVGYVVSAKGNLTVAGVTQAVTLIMNAAVNSDGSITFTGSKELKMSDYHVERPSLLFGMIRARDEMTLTYTLIFTQ